jgi:hypothetical protein
MGSAKAWHGFRIGQLRASASFRMWLHNNGTIILLRADSIAITVLDENFEFHAHTRRHCLLFASRALIHDYN